MEEFSKSRPAQKKWFNGKRSFEHWYRDNQVYFITARCRNKFPAFRSDLAQSIFWEKWDQYTAENGFVPFVTSLMVNHYHTIGYLKEGKDLKKLMQLFHGSVAKLVNDTLKERLTPFWFDGHGHKSYFDGCLRDEGQGIKTYRYVYTQCRRHKICADPANYANTHVNIDMDTAIRRATEKEAFMYGVGYKRYEDR